MQINKKNNLYLYMFNMNIQNSDNNFSENYKNSFCKIYISPLREGCEKGFEINNIEKCNELNTNQISVCRDNYYNLNFGERENNESLENQCYKGEFNINEQSCKYGYEKKNCDDFKDFWNKTSCECGSGNNDKCNQLLS